MYAIRSYYVSDQILLFLKNITLGDLVTRRAKGGEGTLLEADLGSAERHRSDESKQLNA